MNYKTASAIILVSIKLIAMRSVLAAHGVAKGVTRLKFDQRVVFPSDFTSEDLNETNLRGACDPLPQPILDCLQGNDQECSAKSLRMRKTIKMAVTNDCKSCSESDKHEAGHVLMSLIYHHPEVWQKILTRYGADQRYHSLLTSD